VNVKIMAAGLLLNGPNTKSVTMPRGGQMEVRFPIKATTAGEATVKFDVHSGADADVVEIKRKVEIPVSIESTTVYGEASNEAAIALGDLTQMRRDFGGLDVRVSSSALAGIGLVVDRLSEYPYDCTEQIASRILPLTATWDLTKDSGAKLPADLNVSLDAALEQMLKRQNYEGGFGYWNQSEIDPYLSAYAMLAVGAASEKKRFIPRDVLERGKDYMQTQLAERTRLLAKAPKDEDKRDDDADAGSEAAKKAAEKAAQTEKDIEYAFFNGAMFIDTLTTMGWPNPAAANILYDAREGHRVSGKALLLHAMAKGEMNQAQLKTLRGEIEARIRVNANEAEIEETQDDRWDALLDSPVRTQAMVLRALLAVDPKHPLGSRLARRLLAMRQADGAWRTTQEDAWALMALSDYRKLQESGAGALDARTLLGGSEIMHSKFPRGSFREDKIFVSADTIASKGPTLSFDVDEGHAFYTAQLKYATATLPKKPLDEGLFVAKYIRGVQPSQLKENLNAIPKQSASEITAGELVIVDLLFETAEPRERVVIDDPLPAGLEALDYELDTTNQYGAEAMARAAEEKKNPPKFLGTTFRPSHPVRKVHDDRVNNFFDRIEPGMYHVRYLARATAIGTFVMPPTRIEAMYQPEIFGRTAATTLTVKPRP
jgi:uncharacterized protein YfaS (alpha-2-macroglobulin family)